MRVRIILSCWNGDKLVVNTRLLEVPDLLKYDSRYWLKINASLGGAMHEARAWYREIRSYAEVEVI